MSEMIERVARAMRLADVVDAQTAWSTGEREEFDRAWATSSMRESWLTRARAAIEAMREPTDAMIAAGAQRLDEQSFISDQWEGNASDALIAYNAMITAALFDTASKASGLPHTDPC